MQTRHAKRTCCTWVALASLLAWMATGSSVATAQEAAESDSDSDSESDSESDSHSDSHSESESEPAPQPTVSPSGVRGRVVDSRTGHALADAVVIAQGESGNGTAISDETGGYVLTLDPGLYTISALYDLYHGARMPRVRVRSERFSDLTLTLDPIDAEVVAEEVEIVYRADTRSAAAQDQLRAASVGIGEGLGSQQMSRSGASDAGSAARTSVGVSIEGASLNVRGLGGRYTLVMLNGVPLPSTDPDVPSVDLDLFPTNVIESLQISKAFLPDLPGSFAGGVLDLRTVRYPRRFTFDLGVSVGANTETTLRDRLDYRGGDLDWLGVDDGTRALPSGLTDRLQVTRSGRYQSFDALEAEAERFPNRWQYEPVMSSVPFGLDLTLGDRVDLGGDRRFGYLVTAGYDYAVGRTTGLSRTRPRFDEEGNIAARGEYDAEQGSEDVQLVGFGTASLELGEDDALTLTTLFNRSASDITQHQIGENAELGTGELTERWQMQWVARTLWLTQLRGDHRNIFGERLRLRWNVYGSYGAREEPDRRSVAYGPQGSLHRWLEKSQSGERFYSDLDQIDLGGLTDLRFPLWSEAWGTVGGHVRYTLRDLTNRRFRMLQDPENLDQTAYQAPVEDLFDEQGIGTLTRILEQTRGNDSYHAEQGYYAAFAMLETPVAGPLSLTGGARFEAFDQRIASASPFEDERTDPAATETTSRTDLDVLPAAALRLQLTEEMVLRASYGMTVARPQIREIAPYQYYDFVRDRNVQGSPELERTLIQNADIRWELFLGEGEILAVSGFYKYFDRPIELQIANPSTYDSIYVNAREAHNVGAEVEARISLGRITPELSWLRVSGNLALIWSEVSFDEDDAGAVRAQRPLYGQAPYVANLSLEVDHADSGIQAALVYNVVGPRVSLVGTRVNDRVLPDEVREPFHGLDLVLGWRIDEHWRLRLKVKNLLYRTQRYTQGDLLTERTVPGTSFSLGLTYSY
jgi:outer membrane receptor protein involved in Fe transport